ncbi:MAG TPA: hypothetical protein VMW50_08830 [Dehalococcoidia bacterium]|nr:hypothetical protein [Dehalococcoidia bacterium]
MIGQFYYRKAISQGISKSIQPKFCVRATDEICSNPAPILLEYKGAFTLIPIEFIKDAIETIIMRQKLSKTEKSWNSTLHWEMGTPVSSKVARILLAGSGINNEDVDDKTPNSGESHD